MKPHSLLLWLIASVCFIASTASAQDTVEEYLREFPNQEQVKMMEAWLEKNEKGTFQFTGLVDPTDSTVVTPQATVNYGYKWFSASDGPAIIETPRYDKFFSVSIFDMKHNVPAVVVNPEKPILIKRPGQQIPDGDFNIVTLETDQGLVLTRMVVVNNLDEVMNLSKEIVMEGGKGDMTRNVQRFSQETERNAHAVIDTLTLSPNGDSKNGIPTGKDFYGILRAYFPNPKAVMKVSVKKQ